MANTQIRGTTQVKDATIANAQIAADAAIVYSKLSLSNSIVNADIATAAAIAYSKLNLAGSILDADIGSAAAIAQSKLALAITNAEVGTGAAIAESKLSLDYSTASLHSEIASAVTPPELIEREVPTGAIDGSNVTYTLAHTLNANSECVFKNGILQNVGTGNDYTISGVTITMASAPATGDVLLVNYNYNV